MNYASTPDQQLPSEAVTWGIREIVFGILLALASLVVSAAIVAVPAVAIFGEHSTGADVGNAISQILLDVFAIAAIVWLIRRTGGSPLALGLRAPRRSDEELSANVAGGIPWGNMAGLVIGGLVLCYLAVLGYVAIVQALNLDFLEPSDQIPEDFLRDDIVVFFLGIGVLLVAPVCEELFFRGFVYGGLQKIAGVFPAALLSGLLFSAAHGQPGLVVPFGLIGMIFAFLYTRTRSIFVPMAVHFLFNLISFSLLVASSRDGQLEAAAWFIRRLAP